jgi:acylphosphatase
VAGGVAEGAERATVFVRGHVQGVGFRWWTRARALELGLVGYARNLPDGRVEVVAQGPGDAVDRLIALLEEAPSTSGRPGSVTGVVTQWGRARPGVEGFRER